MTLQEDRKFNRIQKGKSCVGYAEFKDNCWNFSIISTHEHSDVLTNEYLAGRTTGRGYDTRITQQYLEELLLV